MEKNKSRGFAEPDYREVKPANVDLLKEGAWMLYPVKYSDDKCIEEFAHTWARLPKHIIYDPKTPSWKFGGPVNKSEEETRRTHAV